MISIVCIYNDRKLLEEYLIRGLQRQDAAFELICIDNTAGTHVSAAVALNEAVSRVRHEHVMFVHQDVELISSTWLSDVARQWNALDGVGAMGVAGRDCQGVIHASVWHGTPAHFAGCRKPDRLMDVQTLDGCLIITPVELFKSVQFDAATCPGWHLYVADYCLTLGRLGLRCCVLPFDIYHKSEGPASRSAFEDTVKRMVHKHRDHVPRIFTTVGIWPTGHA